MEGKTKHTPGPWVVAHCSYDVCTKLDEGWTIVASASGELPDAECKANARLIAAAPDLLAALKLILQSIPSEMFGDYESDAAYAAIAKANGEGE